MMDSEADGRRGKRNRNIQRSLQLGKKGEDNFNTRRDIWAYKYISLWTQRESVGRGARECNESVWGKKSGEAGELQNAED